MELKELGWNKPCEEFLASIPKGGGARPFRVSFASRDIWRLVGEEGERMAALSGRFRFDGGEGFPVVGDWVLALVAEDGLATIQRVMPRQSELARTSAGGRKGREGQSHSSQPLAANVTKSLIVCGLDRDFNLRRIERYIALSYGGGVQPVLLLNKVDLCPDPDAALGEAATVAPGVEVVPLSALDGSGVEVVRSLIGPGDTVCLLGSSGAGKSTLLNALLSEAARETSAVSHATGKGRHTTSDRELFHLPGGGLIIDTPGLREVGIGGEGLDEAFPEIGDLAAHCRFSDCSHTGEPGCAVAEAVEEGRIPPERWESYLKLSKEAEFRRQAGDSSLAAVEKRKWKTVSKDIRRFFKDK